MFEVSATCEDGVHSELLAKSAAGSSRSIGPALRDARDAAQTSFPEISPREAELLQSLFS